MAIAPNPIIEAFMTGIQQRKENERVANENKYRQDELKQRADEFQQTLKDTQSQHEIENARLESIHQATMAMQNIQQQEHLSNLYSTKGIIPGGYQEDPSAASSVQIEPGVAGTAHTFRTGNLNMPSFTALDPESQARLTGHITDIEQEPIIRRQFEKEKQVQEGQKDIEKLKIESERQKEINAHNAKMAEIALENAGKLNAAHARGTSDKAQAQALAISNRFLQQNKVHDRFVTLSELTNEVNAMPNDTKNPEDDTSLIYAYAKSQDPNYPIRRGSISDIKDYSQTIAKRFGIAVDRISDSATFLSPEARAQMKAGIANRLVATTKEHELVKKDVAAQFRAIGEKPEHWLPSDFSGGPQVGDVVNSVDKNGKTVKIKIKVVHPDGSFDGDPQ